MGQVGSLPSPLQRGDAAHIRQMEDNSLQNTGERILPVEDRHTLNKIIHDPSMEHSPQYDSHLNDLKNKHYQDNSRLGL